MVIGILAKFHGALKWALITLGLVVVQVRFGMIGHGLFAVGMLHGANALGLAIVAVIAGHRVVLARHATAAEPVSRLGAQPPPMAGTAT